MSGGLVLLRWFLTGEPYPLLLKRLAYDLDGEFAGEFDPNPLRVAKD
jgi:hypothetical protein